MMMRLMSPRRTAPYHTLDSSSRITSPRTVAPGTTQTLEWIVGPLPKRAAMPACPVGSESGSTCILDLMLNVRPGICNRRILPQWRDRLGVPTSGDPVHQNANDLLTLLAKCV